ncbi:MAG TPA: aminotransferase class III-fold pyridoxal phosphate-dependent enzyme, partial [Candidatus Ozemobacteraceae bacterium]|nr:aminotransferase class III-fold pyridoxal phosphate-dependent enzyme [Candidatus Ozemobacteraceae bacterium]
MIHPSLHEISAHHDERPDEASERYTQFCYPGFGRQMHAFGLDVSYIRADGDRLWYVDRQGVECEVLDLVGGYGVCLFGHNPGDLIATAQETLRQHPANMAQASVRSGAAEVGQRLSELAEERWHEPFCTALFNTGSDAIEAALKHCRLIRQAQIDQRLDQILLSASQLIRRHQPRSISIDTRHAPRFPGTGFDSSITFLQALDSYNRVITSAPPTLLALRHAYHGLTPGALSLTDCPTFRRPFADLTLPTRFLEPTAEALANTLAGTQRMVARLEYHHGTWRLVPEAISGVLAFFIEPVQGEAGIVEVCGTHVSEMVGLCRRNGIPVVADEVQSGMGRTGRLFAWEHTGAPSPDLIVLGKALGGGLAKVAAVMSRQA